MMPVCFVKAASTDFDTANESWVTRVMVVGDAADAAAGVTRAGRCDDDEGEQEATHQTSLSRSVVPRVGMTARSTPRLERDGGAGPRNSLLTPRVEPGGSVSRCSGKRSPSVTHADGRTAQREQRAQRARCAVELDAIAHDGDVRARRRGRRRARWRSGVTRAGARCRGSGRGDRRPRRPRATAVAPRSSAASSASSRSVASLAAGCRSTTVPSAHRGVERRRDRPSRGRRPPGRRGHPERGRARGRSRRRSRGRRPRSAPARPDRAGRRPRTPARPARRATRADQVVPWFPPPALSGSGSRGRRRTTVALSARLSRAPRIGLSSAGYTDVRRRPARHVRCTSAPMSQSCSCVTARRSGAARAVTRRTPTSR